MPLLIAELPRWSLVGEIGGNRPRKQFNVCSLGEKDERCLIGLTLNVNAPNPPEM